MDTDRKHAGTPFRIALAALAAGLAAALPAVAEPDPAPDSAPSDAWTAAPLGPVLFPF